MDAIKVNCDNYPGLSEEWGGEKQRAKGREEGGGKRREREKPGEENAALPITFGLRMTIHLLQTQDNTVGPQELKYPGAEARSERMGGQGGAAEGGADAGASPSALGAPGLDLVGFQRVLGPWAGDWHLLGGEEGPAAIGGSALFICTVEEAAVWLLIQKRIF